MIIGFIVWLIRLESKVNMTEKETVRLDESGSETWKEFDAHRSTSAIHFDQRLASEVAARQSERMGRIESDVREIKDIVKELATR